MRSLRSKQTWVDSLIINIGMNKSTKFDGVKEGDTLSVTQIREVLIDHGVEINALKIVEGKEENTAILAVKAPHSTNWEEVSEELSQECIALYNCLSLEGRLEGPYSHLWGCFDPKYFQL